MNEEELSEEPVRRVPTGSTGLDIILNGGWMHGGTYMVTGAPGTGKTILGNQLCFSHVAAGGRAVYVTLLSESHGRMMLHLRGMHFFQREVIGQRLHYVSGYATLKAEGLDGLARLLYRAVREHQASVLVVDGLLAVQERSTSMQGFREFLQALGVHNALAGCTTLVLTNQQESAADPQLAMVDGVLKLEQQRVGLQAVRQLEVSKLRGGPQLTGLHTFDITPAGLVVHPRLESLYHHPPRVVPDPERRLGFGPPGFDGMLGGGVPLHSSTLLLGAPGSGKTLLGLHFLGTGARQGECGLYFGLTETGPELLAKTAGVGLELRSLVEARRLLLETRVAAESQPDALAHEVLGLVERHRVRRLVLDGVEPFLQGMLLAQRLPGFLTALLHELRARGVTTLLTQDAPVLFGPQLEVRLEGAESIIDNIVLLRYVEQRSQVHRVLSILKMRESNYESALREVSISPQGIDVAETFENTGGKPRTSRRKGRARPPPSGRRSRA